ncbi:hypothetical protein IMG5_096970 [Ichthyophthirius multifiliis]|uniref:Uncharacterized protein n=1 Tax=Ichthyophthirius multifiliis TaxID=5932 RepID=G0QRS4_ICHMU|nr:hypothetical protein IMG5_096970 [Ichthyophthirius multifiliis]EGR32083.1 hypothetical protein IMG5_096970 [Ichthyophthirius multifiliis]|eukprot:XP_004035569.1 hypothetical protein IMG5_096970 [Ichthyophthirius multifiliis]
MKNDYYYKLQQQQFVSNIYLYIIYLESCLDIFIIYQNTQYTKLKLFKQKNASILIIFFLKRKYICIYIEFSNFIFLNFIFFKIFYLNIQIKQHIKNVNKNIIRYSNPCIKFQKYRFILSRLVFFKIYNLLKFTKRLSKENISNIKQKQIKKCYAHPYNLSENYKPYQNDIEVSKQQKFSDSQLFRPSGIVDQTSSFYTKSFFIKFCEEEVELNDFCHFRYEVDVDQNNENIELFMDVELMFFDCMNLNNNNKETNNLNQNIGNKQQLNNINEINQQKDQNNIDNNSEECCLFNDSKSLQTLKYKIVDTFEGIHEFIPILFEEQNFCVANIIFHSVKLDYRFRVIPMQISEFARMKPEERIALMENQKSQNIQKNLSVYELLQKQYGQIDYKGMYNLFVENLKKSYNKLLNHHEKMSITSKQINNSRICYI